MNLDEATELLNKCQRSELRDHAFGDREICWFLDEPKRTQVAEGYFSGTHASVTIFHSTCSHDFEGDDARQLSKCGAEHIIGRNDETGPDEYQEGVTMPGLTLEGVRQELTGE